MELNVTPAKPAEQKSLFNPALIFLILGTLLGALYCAVIPYGAGFDEEAHLIRIYDISGNHFIPNQDPPSFTSTVTLQEFHELSYQRRDFQSPAFDMFSGESFGRKFSKKEEDLLYGFITNSIYSPIIFAPQAIVARVFWRMSDFPILPVVILERLAGLLLYIAAGYLAIRLLPYGKWALMALALSPMALYQAATLNTDGFTNATSFLFIGLTFYVYARSRTTPIKPGWVLALVGVMLLLGSAKLGSVVLLPLLLILPAGKFSSRKWIAVLAVGAGLAILLNIGWTALVLPNSRFSGGESQDLSRQVERIFSQFGDFFLGYFQAMSDSFVRYFRNWAASYGYWVGTVPEPVYWLYILLLLATVLAEPLTDKLSTKGRVFALGIFLLASAAVTGSYFAVHYANGDLPSIRQGRYSIPFTPLLFIGVSGLLAVSERWRKAAQAVALGCLLLVLGYYSFGLYATYYTDCGYDVYGGGQCVLPIYKNLDTNNIPEVKVNAVTPVSQQFTMLCSGLQAAQVMVNSVPAGGGGTLKFSLLDSASRQVLASRDFTASEISVGEYLTLPVSSSVLSSPAVKGASYEIRLESSSAAPGGFGAAVRSKDAFDGQLSIAGEPSRSDLIFHYVCSAP